MKPVLEDVKARMGEEVSIFKIDVDKNQALAARFNVRSIPTLVLFNKGNAVWRKSGMASSAELIKAVSSFSEN